MFNKSPMPHFWQTLVRRCFFVISRPFTHNYCDSCGWTKSKVYQTKIFSEAGYIECSECIIKPLK